MQGAPAIVAATAKRLSARGTIPFEELMELCLYHPEAGLYQEDCPPRGRAGHYATCAQIDPALAQAVARWAREAYDEALGAPSRWSLVEVGGGDGTMADLVLSALPRSLRSRLTYQIVERGRRARGLMEERLGRRVLVVESMADALRRARGSALIFSNEVVDAFPAVVLEWRDAQWLEVHVERRGEALAEVLREPGPWARRDAPLSVMALTGLREGSRAEAHPSFHRWLREWVPLWQRGRMLTIDYGDDVWSLYGRGGGGTLRAYYKSLRLDDAGVHLERLGQQDLTCDVNFTDLAAWGSELGCETHGLWSQRDLLERYDLLAAEPHRPSLQFIANPAGAGLYFKALSQQRG